MIITSIKADRFGGAAYYNSNKSVAGTAALLYTNMLGLTPKELAFEFDAIAARNPRVKVPALHIIISLSPMDRAMSDIAFRMIAHAYLKEMGFSDCQAIMWRHFDTPQQHVHLLVSRVRLDGSVVPNSLNHRKNHRFSRRMEELLGLQSAAGSCPSEFGKAPAAKREFGRQNILY